MRSRSYLLLLAVAVYLFAFRDALVSSDMPLAPKEMLSDYGFFVGNPADQIPEAGVMPYALNTPLFTDYAEKLRFVKLPPGQSVAYQPDEVLDFPVGTVLIKTFLYPKDARDATKGRRLMETRLLLHEAKGWKALEYIWNDDQTDAYLEVAGDNKEVTWVTEQGEQRTITYSMPNLNQCKGCHNQNEQLRPIGPSVRQLNGSVVYADTTENQLLRWQRLGMLASLPALDQVPQVPQWNNAKAGTVDQRARAWLDINCAHCHSPAGPARSSGLFLHWQETDPTHLGVMKAPVAAGRGSGGRLYGIVPGEPDKSILVHRLESTDPGAMMPELGRRTVHTEGVQLVREWIKELPR
jgi:uncharacterized repeat protein (TIGR03806 family)